MILTYTAASLDLCLDLTDPEARSVTVGAIVLGHADGVRYAALATGSHVPGLGEVDPLTRDLLANIATVLRRKVDSALKQTGFDLDSVLGHLNRSMMGSLYVGRVEPKETIELPGPATNSEVLMRLVKVAFDHLDDAHDEGRTEYWPISLPAEGARAAG